MASPRPRRAKKPADSTYDWREIGVQATLSVSTQDNHRVAKPDQRIHIRELRGKIPEFQSEFAYETTIANHETSR
jgi:hypothetical protein